MQRTTAVGLAAAVLGLAVGCSRKASPPAPDASAGLAPVASNAASAAPGAVVASDAGPVFTGVVDLLRHTPARLMVSSNVQNPRDYPEHLVDGKSATAWNSRSGDLVGATIAFEVPADAQLQSLVLSAGFDAIDAKGADLFSKNYRIKSVAVYAGSLEDDPVATLSLDTTRREPQSFAFVQPGGLYWLKVTAVRAGTQASWKELAVSEFRVMGTPGALGFSLPRMPDVSIGKEWIDRPLPGTTQDESSAYQTAIGTFHPTITALCTQIETAIEKPFLETGNVAAKPWCLAKVPETTVPARIKSIAWIDLLIPEGSASSYVIETERGFVIPRNAELSLAPCPPGCMDDVLRVSTHIERADYVDDVLTLAIRQARSSSEAFDRAGVRTPATDTTWFTLRCPMGVLPVTCARSDTKKECVMGGKPVACR